MKSTKTTLLTALGLAGVVTLLSACSSEPSPWTKRQSPWDQRRESMQAPAAEQYKQDLGSQELDSGGPGMEDADLSYQAGDVAAYAPGVQEPVPQESMDVSPQAAPVASPTSTDMGDDIMGVPADYYTIQLIASVDEDRVYKFAEQNGVSIRYVVPTQRDGVIWYVLLLDVYPDYPSARDAMADVAGNLPTKPWVRKVGSVQNLVR